MKKNILIAIIVVVVLALGIVTAFLIKGRNASKIEVEPEEEGVLIETPLKERPYVTLTPRADGKEFTLEISRFGDAETIEYELVYLSQGLSRGVVGSVEVKGESSISRDLLLGTCSRNVCKYDEGVEEGTLTLRFRSEEGTRKLTADFHLQQGDDDLTSVDEKFTLSGNFSPTTFYITMSTVGLPEELEEGEIVAGPYGVFTAGSTAAKKSTLTITLPEDSSEAKLFFFDGRNSGEEEAEIEDNELTATVDSLGTFFVIK
jgi:hypothetical protein